MEKIARIHQIAENEIDDTVAAAKRHRRFGAFLRQGVKAVPLPPASTNAENTKLHPVNLRRFSIQETRTWIPSSTALQARTDRRSVVERLCRRLSSRLRQFRTRLRTHRPSGPLASQGLASSSQAVRGDIEVNPRRVVGEFPHEPRRR